MNCKFPWPKSKFPDLEKNAKFSDFSLTVGVNVQITFLLDHWISQQFGKLWIGHEKTCNKLKCKVTYGLHFLLVNMINL